MKRVLISMALLAGTMVFAGGFRVSLQGVKQLAMAHTSAHTEDASVAFFNPAGISFIPSKLSVAAGGFGVKSSVTYQNLNTLESYTTNNPMGTPIYAAIAYKISDGVSVGFSFATPFGSTVEYPENWSGKEFVQRLELKSYYFQPMVSFKLAPWVSLGASYIYSTGKVDWTKAATQLNGSVNLMDDKARGHGFGLGFYMKPTDKLDLSIAYRSPVDMNAKNGTATFNVTKSLYPLLGLNANGQDSFQATLPLVEEFTLGATYKITPKWIVSGDLNYHGWERYNALKLDFSNATIGNQANDNTVLVSQKNFKNSRTFRLGTQYQINNMIAGRLGWFYDEAVYHTKDFTPETPSFDTQSVTAGLGFKIGKGLGVDLAGAVAFPEYRTFNNVATGFSGQAKAKAFYFGLGISYNAF